MMRSRACCNLAALKPVLAWVPPKLEPAASTLGRYQELLGCSVEPCRFRVLREDDVHGWLGASPDGLIASLTTQGAIVCPRCEWLCTWAQTHEHIMGLQ